MKCRKRTDTTDVAKFTAKNGRLMQRGTCSVCGKVKTGFIKSGTGLFNTLVSKLPVELHLPGHNFTGPGTKLDRRLNADGTPKEWSKPVNRVDRAAYYHDLCYAKHPDTKIRNEVCDREMLKELGHITDPSLRERLDRGLVINLIKAKVILGLGLKSSKKAVKWTDQLAEELHKPVIKKFRKRRVYVKVLMRFLLAIWSTCKHSQNIIMV